MADRELIEAVSSYEQYIASKGIDEKVIEHYIKACDVAIRTQKDIAYGLRLTARVKELIEAFVVSVTGVSVYELEKYQQDNKTQEYGIIKSYYDVLKLESYDVFESFVLFMERGRHYTKRFYKPRQCTLKIVADDLQWLETDPKVKFYGLSMPSRVGKSTICIFFLGWKSLRHPNIHNAMGGHSGTLVKGFYKELMNLFTSADYTFWELFQYWHPEYANNPFPTDKSAEDYTITLGDPDRFATITCRGIDGTWTGAVDVSSGGILYIDDLVRDREHSLSPIRMENTFQEYLNKMADRKNDGAKELMVGTLWNVYDPLERMRQKYDGRDGYRFRRIPALDENDQSNFQYEFNGFSTEYYWEMRERLDKAEWEAKYQQRPFVREGLLFPGNELQYFDGLIDDEHDRQVIAVCDPAFGGADSLSMPVCLHDLAENKRCIVGWVHKRGTQAVTVPLVVNAIEKYHITELHIEQNAGGKLLSDSIRAEMNRRGVVFCRIIPYYASIKMAKGDKIKGCSDWIKENLYFLIPNVEPIESLDRYGFRRDEQYNKAMNELMIYTSEGKNPHDDAPDALSQLAEIVGKKRRQTVVISDFW